MGGLFGGSKVKTPKPEPPPAIPEVGIDTEDLALRKARRGKGFEQTFLTGDLVPSSTLNTRLG